MKKITPSPPTECRDMHTQGQSPEPFGPRRETLALLSWFARIYTPEGTPNPALPIAN